MNKKKFLLQSCLTLLFLGLFGLVQTIPLIDQLTLENNTITIKPNKTFKESFLSNDFFAQYRNEDVDLTTLNKSILIMPFLMNVIPLIWLSHETWEIDEIDAALFESLKLIKEIFIHMYPKANWQGQLRAKKLVYNTIEPSKNTDTFAMPFSGGLDSIHTSLSNKNSHQILITLKEHRGFLNNKQWDNATKNVIEFAQQCGHDNVLIDSNYQRFIKNKTIFSNTPGLGASTSHGLGWVGIVAPVLVAKKCKNFKIASSISWGYPYQKILCPMVDDNIKFANVTIKHDGFDFTRPDKVDQVSFFFKNKKHQAMLYVCQENQDASNCCTCEKCVRTIAALMAIGEISFFEYGFNISLENAQVLVKTEALKWAKNQFWRLEALQKKIKERRLEIDNTFLNWLCALTLSQQKSHVDWHGLHEFVAHIKQTLQASQPMMDVSDKD